MMPRGIDVPATQALFFGLERGLQLPEDVYPPMLKQTMEVLRELGWRFYIVHSARRGRAHSKNKDITIPAWAVSKSKGNEGFYHWYVAHECAHAVNFEVDNGARLRIQHGPMFMYRLMQICPRQYQHYELEYKPQNAAAAGIRKEDV